MDFVNQSWFWSGLFVTAASLGTFLIQELWRPKSQARIERLKLYDSEIFAAHKSAYEFASTMRMYFAPPDDPRRDFVAVMKSDFQKFVRPNMLLFSPAIRQILADFQAQYHCIGDPDLSPSIPFEEFIASQLHRKLDELEKHIEQSTDSLLKGLR
jgi:hypothetical protein